MADTITLAIDALASAAFIEGGVSIERTNEAREYTEQRKRELIETIAASHPQAAPAAVAAPDVVTDEMVHAALRIQKPHMYRDYLRHPSNGATFAAQVEKEIDTTRGMIAAALAATPEIPATGDSSAGDLAEAVHASTYVQPVPDHCDRIVWHGQYIHLPIAQAEVQAEPVAERLDIDMHAEGRNPVEMLDRIFAIYQRSMGKPAPDAEMAQIVATTKEMIFSWWAEHRELIREALAAPQAQPAFQQRVQPWMMECFGVEHAADRKKRNQHFLEEALELVQSTGWTQSEAHQLVDYVYGRPAGEPAQEVGGVMVTLAALCLANHLDMHACGETELARIWSNVDIIRARQAAKPSFSPLPQAQPADALDAARYRYLRDGWTYHYQHESRETLDASPDAAMAAAQTKPADALDWAVQRWNDEVRNRPMVNIHRRSLDDTWRQVITYLGGDACKLVGPSHDDLLAAAQEGGKA